MRDLKAERDRQRAEELLAKNGKFYVNWESTDCDGVHGQGSVECTSVKEMEDYLEDKCEWADGPIGWSVEDYPVESMTWGQGWGIN